MQTLTGETSQFTVKVTAVHSLKEVISLLEMRVKISSDPSQKSNNPCCRPSYHILFLNLYLQCFTSFTKAHPLPDAKASLYIADLK